MRSLFIIIIGIMLTACSSSPVKVSYYLLDQDTSVYKNNNALEKRPQLSITRVKLSNYLTQSQLAILQDNNQIYYASQHLWAESLYSNVRRSLVNDLNSQSHYQVRLSGDPSSSVDGYQLDIQIDHLVATDQSNVILAGKYWILKGGKIVSFRDFYLTKALTESGFNHSITQQRQLLRLLADDINQVLPEIKSVSKK